MITERLKEVLHELNIDKDTIEQFSREKISNFFDVFLKNNIFLTRKTLTGDFLNSLGFQVYKGLNETHDLRRVLSYSFNKHIIKAVKEGRMEKYNTNCYKVKKKTEILSYKLYKITYPYICGDCGYLHYEKRTTCEGCGKTLTLRKVDKQDYKVWKSERK